MWFRWDSNLQSSNLKLSYKARNRVFSIIMKFQCYNWLLIEKMKQTNLALISKEEQNNAVLFLHHYNVPTVKASGGDQSISYKNLQLFKNLGCTLNQGLNVL